MVIELRGKIPITGVIPHWGWRFW